jgi:hypothetical protein
LNELNRGPRAKGYFKNQKGFVPSTVAVKGQSVPSSDANAEEKDKTTEVPDREQYNKADFPVEYVDAKFFIIKSYSEDDVHKCIKYNVWASTPNGNKKLDAAYQEAGQKSGGCPVFLLFSVSIGMLSIFLIYYPTTVNGHGLSFLFRFFSRSIPVGNLWDLQR